MRSAQSSWSRRYVATVSMCVGLLSVIVWQAGLHTSEEGAAFAVQQTGDEPTRAEPRTRPTSGDASGKVLTEAEWDRVDASVARALTWLSKQQGEDGAFPSIDSGQPGVTSLCVMAFMAHGHLPGEGQYGRKLDKALEFVLTCQKQNGLISLSAPDGPTINRTVSQEIGVTSAYNHAISALALAEIYGMSRGARSDRLKQAITTAMEATLQMQRWPKDQEADRGGWRYVNPFDQWDSDLSVTGWNLMFLRSSRNAGFTVPEEAIENAVAYVRRSFSDEHNVFEYIISPADTRSRAMAGAGVLALAHAGLHNSDEAKQSGDWLLRQSFNVYNHNEPFDQVVWVHDRYHYALFNACQGMYQLGDKYWEQFFPPVARMLLEKQQPDGSWPAESHVNDAKYGNAYTTALVVLSLGASNQILPIFQR